MTTIAGRKLALSSSVSGKLALTVSVSGLALTSSVSGLALTVSVSGKVVSRA